MPMKTEAEWQAEADAHSLAEAKKINDDPDRKRKAVQAAKKMADEQAERTAALRSVARQSPGNAARPKPTANPSQGGVPTRRVARGKSGRPGTRS